MYKRFIFMTILGAVFLGTCNAAPLNTNEVEAKQFVSQVSEKLYNYYNKLSHDAFNIEDKDPAAILEDFKTIVKTANALAGIVNDSKVFDYTQFKDEELKYIFEILRRSAEEAVVGEEKYVLIITCLIALDELSSDKDIQAYHNSSVELAYFPDVQNVFARSNDPEELKYYWTAWRQKKNLLTLTNFYILVNGLKDAANLTEITPLEFWLSEYNVTEMEQVMTQLHPLYRQLHAFIRNQLQKKYGDSVIKSNAPIPDHLFQQVLAQAWTNGSVIDEIYPHKDLPPYDKILKKNNYDTLRLFKTADKFYQSLGFDPIPDDLWASQIKMNKDEDEGDCQATIFDLTPNVYMRYCHKMDFRKFLQAHGYMGRLYYARQKTNLPAYYFSSHDLEYPVGEAVILSASTPKHLHAVEIVTDFKFTDEVQMNRLLRMGIHTLLNVPVYFVHTKVMADLFAETVELEKLNKHYWMLMEKYVGVEPPVDRLTPFYDFPFKFYIDLNENSQAVKFDSEILGYQFYKKLCEISGQYPQEPLQKCDFYGSKDVGNALKKMMKLGSSKSFDEVLATLLPESPTVNADSLLEYYQPIMTWLSNKNVEANVKLGWAHSDKKIV